MYVTPNMSDEIISVTGEILKKLLPSEASPRGSCSQLGAGHQPLAAKRANVILGCKNQHQHLLKPGDHPAVFWVGECCVQFRKDKKTLECP